MKFGKRLRNQIEDTLPEWRNKFLSYKELKKRLKTLAGPECFTEVPVDEEQREKNDAAEGSSQEKETKSSELQIVSSHPNANSEKSAGEIPEGVAKPPGDSSPNKLKISEEEQEFQNLLNGELDKFNNFFMDKEEDYIIKLQDLKDRTKEIGDVAFEGSKPSSHVMNIRRELVAVHGEMVLLENYSILNYMGLIKILKKHDKRTGAVLRKDFVGTILHQPFYKNDVLSKLVKECECLLQTVFPPTDDEKIRVQGQARPASSSNMPAEQPSTSAAQEAGDHWSAQTQQVPEVPLMANFDVNFVRPDTEVPDHIFRSTIAALRTLQEMRGHSATPQSGVVEEGNGSGNCVSTLTKAACSPDSDDEA